MKLFRNTFLAVFFAAFLACLSTTESCVLLPSSPSTAMNDIFSMLFGCSCPEIESSPLKYDRQSETWVEECPALQCQYGVDEGDYDVCPICLLGPDEGCGDWKGKCGEEMICQYSSAFSSSGKCVLKSEFNSRKAGEACSCWEGKCLEGLKCRLDTDPMFSVFIEESGICVTEEEFSSRSEGETCGGDAGTCGEGLICRSDNLFSQSTCRYLEKQTTDDFSDNVCESQFFDKSLSNEEPVESDADLVVKTSSDEDIDALEKLENDMIESLFGTEVQPDKMLDSSFLMDAIAFIGQLLEMPQVQSTTTNNSTAETTVEVSNYPDNDRGSLIISMKIIDSGNNVEESGNENGSSISVDTLISDLTSDDTPGAENPVDSDSDNVEDETLESVVSI